MSINDIISEYLATKALVAQQEKRVKELASVILEHAGTAESFTTDDFIVTISKTES